MVHISEEDFLREIKIGSPHYIAQWRGFLRELNFIWMDMKAQIKKVLQFVGRQGIERFD